MPEAKYIIINEEEFKLIDETARHPEWNKITNKPFDDIEKEKLFLFRNNGTTNENGTLNITITDRTLFGKIFTEETYEISVGSGSPMESEDLKPVWISNRTGTSKIFTSTKYGWTVTVRIEDADDSHHVILSGYIPNEYTDIWIKEYETITEHSKLKPKKIDIDALKIALNLIHLG